MIKLSTTSSETINFLKCILAIGVVMLHARYTEIIIDGKNLLDNGDFSIFIFFIKSLKIFLQICVPIYFLISGYLFFLNTNDKISKAYYYSKYKSRFHTLIIPYLIGNVAIIFLFFLAERFLGGMMSGANRPISDYSFFELIQSLWYQQTNEGPINEVLWFIRELIVMVALSPLFYWLIKKSNYLIVIALMLLYIFYNARPFPGLRPVALFFYVLGAFISINEKDVFIFFSRFFYQLMITYVSFLLIAIYTESIYWEKISVIVGVPFFMLWMYNLIRNHHIHIEKKWITATFFLYIYHNYPAIILKKLLIKLLNPSGSPECFIIYIVTVIVISVLMLLLYFLLKRLIPKTLGVIVGGR